MRIAPPSATQVVLIACALATAASAAPSHDPDGRLEAISREIAMHPEDPLLYLERGQLHHHEEDLEPALEDFDRALALDAELTVVHLARARTLLEAGRPREALTAVECFLEVEDEHAEARLLRAAVLAELGEWAEAAPAYDAALLHLAPRGPQHFLDASRAWAAATPESLEHAIATLERGISELGPVPSLVALASELSSASGAALASRHPAPAPRRGPREPGAVELLVEPGRMHASAAAASPAAVPPANATSSNVRLVARGAIWRYLDDGMGPGAGWQSPGFDDSAWLAGRAQLGYGEGDETTIVSFGPNPKQKHATTYFRHAFQVANPGSYSSLLIGLLRDDGAVVYLNGTEIARSNLRQGWVGSSTYASSEVEGPGERAFFHFQADAGLLVQGTNVVAVEIHQSQPASTDLSFDLELFGGSSAAGVVRGPYLQMATPTSAVLRWHTSIPTSTAVWGGFQSGSLLPVVSDRQPKKDHTVRLRGLRPETRYSYAVGDVHGLFVGNDGEHHFVTPPRRGDSRPTRVWVIGDSGDPGARLNSVRDGYLSVTGNEHTDVWLMLGDNAYPSGTQAEYQKAVFETFPMLLRNTFLWPVLGNHDSYSASSGSQSGAYYDIFVLPQNGEAGGVPSGTEAYYSFDHGDIHFIALDSQDTDRSPNGAMMTWLKADLAAAAQATWIIAFWHHPPYSKGSHDSDSDWDSGGRLKEMREVALPILEAGGVDLVLSGHSHAYERSVLLDGHYGKSWTLRKAMTLDRGDGWRQGDGTYAKPSLRGSNEGAIYVVAGNGSLNNGGPLNHPAMHVSLNELGSLVLEVDGKRLDGAMLDSTGTVRDVFTLQKGVRRTLRRDEPRLSAATGGAQKLHLDAGPAFAGDRYVVAGSFGSAPGFRVGPIAVPLNQDGWFRFSLRKANTAIFQQTVGTLDRNGRAVATIDFPPMPVQAIGRRIYHAFVVTNASGSAVRMASNPVWVTLEP